MTTLAHAAVALAAVGAAVGCPGRCAGPDAAPGHPVSARPIIFGGDAFVPGEPVLSQRYMHGHDLPADWYATPFQRYIWRRPSKAQRRQYSGAVATVAAHTRPLPSRGFVMPNARTRRDR